MMIAKTKLMATVLALFIVSNCAGMQEPAPEVPVVPCEDEAPESNFEPQQSSNEYVNYTQTAANYREYGERSPRDQYITQAGSGNNLSAAIPPRIEDEFLDYEEEIRSSENNDGMAETEYAEGYIAEDPVEDWLAEEGKTLKELLTDWSDKSGWRLVWKSNRNYTLTAGAMFRGRFADVSSALIRAFARAQPAPIGTFYKGNRVLVVETLEDENAYE